MSNQFPRPPHTLSLSFHLGYIHPLTTAAQSAGINSSNPHHRLTTQPFQHPRHLSIHSSPPNTPQPPPSNITPSLLYLITTHGKSKHYAIWKYSLLLESNLNLIRANPLLSPNDYLLPDSGCLLPLRNIAMAFFHNI